MKKQIATYVIPSDLPFADLMRFRLLDESTPYHLTMNDTSVEVYLTDVSTVSSTVEDAQLIIQFTGEHLPPELTQCKGHYHLRLPIDALNDSTGDEVTFEENTVHIRNYVQTVIQMIYR